MFDPSPSDPDSAGCALCPFIFNQIEHRIPAPPPAPHPVEGEDSDAQSSPLGEVSGVRLNE